MDVSSVVDIPDVITGERGAAAKDEDAVNDVDPDTEENTRRDPVDIREDLSRPRLRSTHDCVATGPLTELSK